MKVAATVGSILKKTGQDNREEASAISGLVAPVRTGTYSFTTAWKSKKLFDKKRSPHLDGIAWKWHVDLVQSKSGDPSTSKVKSRWTSKTFKSTSSKKESASINLNNFATGSVVKTVEDLYPSTSWCVVGIGVTVWGFSNNKKTKLGDLAKPANAYRKIEPPKAPSITTIEQTESNGDLSCTIAADANAGSGYRPRTRTQWTRTIINTLRSTTGKDVKSGKFSGNSLGISYDAYDRQALEYTHHIWMEVTAYCEGIGGKSSSTPQSRYVSWPNEPAIVASKIVCPERGVVGKVTVPITLNKTTEHPTTGVRMEKLVSVPYSKASEIPADAGWENCGVQDDGKCSALTVPTGEVIPAEGAHTWVRLKSWNDIENLFKRYSKAVELVGLYKDSPTAEDDQCEIVEVTSAADGNGAVVVVGFANDGNTGTEVTWSENKEAWSSTDQPDSFQVTWNDDVRKSNDWAKTTTLQVRGLKEGVEYHFKARRYLDGDAGLTHSKWSAPKTVTPALAPSGVVLSIPASVRRGSGCEARWVYLGGTQRSWRLLSNGVVAASGDDQGGSCSITADVLEKLADANGSVPLSVEVTTAGGHAESDVRTISLRNAPTLTLENATLTAQPLGLSATCSDGNAAVGITIRAQGCSATAPGQSDQVDGDVVWSDIIVPAWEAIEENEEVVGYSTTIQAPTGLDFRNKALYTVTASATDPDTELSSEEATCEVAIDWARTAPTPRAEITPFDTTDEGGVRTIGCEILLLESEEEEDTADPGDRFDIWRVTPDGLYLVCEDAAYDDVVEDNWAAYSAEGNELAYRVVVITPDGDCEWFDFPYELSVGVLRIDFNDTYVELPFNMSFSDSWTKDFETRRKLDGSIDGYWNTGASRSGGFRSEIVRIDDAETASRVRKLGRYAGACLVRSPDGCCYMANVEVSELSWAFTDVLMAVSLDATEIAMTEEYGASVRVEPEDVPDEEEEEPLEGE